MTLSIITAHKNAKRPTDNVENESSDGADERENDKEPSGGSVAADEVLGPVLHVRVKGRLRQDCDLRFWPHRRLSLLPLRQKL